jgi:DEAD/DEAH box helicase domain-containing protein
VQDRLLEASADLIASCECERGCPSCVGPIGEIGPQGKRVALELLQRITGHTPITTPAHAAIEDGEVPF